MTLAEFRELTAHLDGDMELTAGGGDVAIVWHNQRSISIDDGMPWLGPEHSDSDRLTHPSRNAESRPRR